MITVELRMGRLIEILDEEEQGLLFPQITEEDIITQVDITPISITFTIEKETE